MKKEANLSKAKQALLAMWRRGESNFRLEKPIQPRSLTSNPPLLSYAQQRLWFLDQFEPGQAFY